MHPQHRKVTNTITEIQGLTFLAVHLSEMMFTSSRTDTFVALSSHGRMKSQVKVGLNISDPYVEMLSMSASVISSTVNSIRQVYAFQIDNPTKKTLKCVPTTNCEP
jgi:hypothetical protein